MKKFFSNIKNKATEMAVRAKTAIENVVIGALLLAGLYALFNSTIMPTVTQKIQELFNYQG